MGKKPAGKKGSKVDDDDAILNAALQEAGAERDKAAAKSKDGIEAMSGGSWEQAVSFFTEAIGFDPNDCHHYRRRSEAQEGARKHDLALADAKTAVELGAKQSPQDGGDCACHLGVLLSRRQPKEALEAFERGLKICPDHRGCSLAKDELQAKMRQGPPGAPLPGPDDVAAQLLATMSAPEEILGSGFDVLKVTAGEKKEAFSFLVSTTAAEEMVITPAACAKMGMTMSRTVDLKDLSFEGGSALDDFSGCTVTGFMQETIASKALGSTLHGIVGLPFLQKYDVDLHRARGEQRVKKAGAASAAPKAELGAAHLPCLALPSGLLGLPVMVRYKQKSLPLLGIVDTGSMFSVVSWQAAKELGIGEDPDDPKFDNATKVVGPTAEGMAEMPIVNLKVSVFPTPEGLGCKLGGISKEEFDESGKGNGWNVDIKAKDLKAGIECGRINAAVGDAIQLKLLGDGAVGNFLGGVVFMGQDILTQFPHLTLSARDRCIWADHPVRVVDCPPI